LIKIKDSLLYFLSILISQSIERIFFNEFREIHKEILIIIHHYLKRNIELNNSGLSLKISQMPPLSDLTFSFKIKKKETIFRVQKAQRKF